MNANFLRAFTCWLVILLPSFLALAASPVVKELRPRGAQRGKPFTLTLMGTGLSEDCKILSALPASFTPLTPITRSQAGGDDEFPFLVEPQGAARAGLYPIRMVCPDGLSNILLFSVGVFPEVLEEEAQAAVHRGTNDSPEKSQRIEKLPVTVNGTLKGPDRDVYRIGAQKGERLVLEVEARRAGSALDPVIRVLDSEQEQIAMNNDAPGLNVDCRLDLTFPAPGDYYVVVHDSRFSEQEQNFYRLKMGTFAYADGIFPLGWRRGETASVELYGGNLPQSTKVQVDVTRVDREDRFTLLWPPGGEGSLPFVFAAGDLPEMLEPEDQKVIPLQPSTVVNGRLTGPQEVDRYKLAVGPGERWLVEMQAADLGTSRLSAVLAVHDDTGKRLDSAGDEIPDPDVFALISPGATSSDPYLHFEVPEGVREVFITVEDLVGRGGPLYSYRLWAKSQPPDFILTLTSPYVNVPAGGAAALGVTATRRGYIGPIQLKVENGGDDLSMQGGFIPEEIDDPDNRKLSREGMLTIAAKEGAQPAVTELSVWGEGVLDDGTVIRRRAQGPGLVTRVFGGTGVHDPNNRDRQEPFVAPWLGLELPAMLRKELPARLVVQAPQQVRLLQGMEYDFGWEFQPKEPGVRPPRRLSIATPGARELRITREDPDAQYEKSGVFTLVTTVGTPPSRFDLVVSGEVEVQGSKEVVYAPAITVEVAQGYTLVVPPAGLTFQAGGEGELVGRVERDPLFTQPVAIRPENFPPGVTCSPTEVTGSEEEFRVLCRAEPSAAPGEYGIDLVSSSTLAGRDKEKVPYNIAPLKALLVVSPEKGVTRAER